MAGVKFFNGRKIQLYVGYPSGKRNKNQERMLVIPFRIALDGKVVRSAPEFVQSAYAEIKNGASRVNLKKEIENVDCSIFNLPENKRAALRLPRLHLKKLAVAEVKNSEGDASTVLSFKTEYPWDEVTWEFLGDRYKTDAWAEFQGAQASLLDVIETGPRDEGHEEDEGEGEVEAEEAEESEAAEAEEEDEDKVDLGV